MLCEKLIHSTVHRPASTQHKDLRPVFDTKVCSTNRQLEHHMHPHVMHLCFAAVQYDHRLTWHTQYKVSFSYSSEALESECVSHRHLDTTRIAWPFFCPRVTYDTKI